MSRAAATCLCLVTWLSFQATLSAAPAGAELPATGTARVVVYNLAAEQGFEALAAQLSDEILVYLSKDPSLQVIGESELKVMVEAAKEKEAVTCQGQEACLAKIGQAAEAEKVITGRVGHVGDTYLVSLKVADAQKAVVEGGETASADDKEGLPAEVRAAVDRLLGRAGAAAAPRFKMELAGGSSAAVLDLAGHDVSEGLPANLTQLLSLELKKFEGLSVISRDEIQAMLRYESEKQVVQCKEDTSCLVEIGGALGVDYLVSGSVGRLGDAYVLTLKLMDIGEARVVNRVSETFTGAEANLPQALRFASWHLVGKESAGQGQLALQANVREGSLVVDSGDAQPWPLKTPLSALTVGKHGVNLTADGFYPLYQEAYVEPGRSTDLRLTLKEVPRPWYKQWWPWTIMGTAVAAGTVTTVLLLLKSPSTGTVTATVK